MDLEDVLTEILDEAQMGQNLTTHRTRIIRKLRVTLGEMDAMTMWRCAVVDFTKSVPANKNKVSVSSTNLFKPLICNYVTSDGVKYPLTYREMTNFEMKHAAYGTGTTDKPTIYTIGGGNIYIGPGIMAARTVISGKVRRRLTENDVSQLPAPMLVSGTVKRLAKDVDRRTNARINWLTMRKEIITAASKHTSEERDTSPLDPVIQRNINYMSTLKR